MPFHPHPHDLPSAPPAISEISFLRSQLARTAREHTLRLALLSNSYNSRISQLSCQYDELSSQYGELSHQHDAAVRMHDTTVVLLKHECEGRVREVEVLHCELESLRCRYDAMLDIMRREADENVLGLDEKVKRLEEEREELVKEQQEARRECVKMDVELTKVRKERDEGIEVGKVRDAELEELREKVKTLSAENAALSLARNAQARTAKVKNLPTAPRAMIMASASASSSFVSSMPSSSFSRSAVPCPPATSMVDIPMVRLFGGPNRPEVEKEDTLTMTMTTSSSSSSSNSSSSSSSSSSFLSQSQSQSSTSISTSSIATSTSAPSSSSVSPIAAQCTGAPRRVPGVFFPTGTVFGYGSTSTVFGHESTSTCKSQSQVKSQVTGKAGPSLQEKIVVASPSFTPHSDVRATSAFPALISSSTSLSSNAHLNNTALSKPLQQTKSQTKPQSTIIRSDKPSAFASLTNLNPKSVSTSAFASTSNPLPASGSTSTSTSSSTGRMAKRIHSSAFMDDYEYEYIAPAPGFSLIDRIEPRTSTTLPARKRLHFNGLPVTGLKTQLKTGTGSSGTGTAPVPVPWSRAVLKAADSEGLKLDRMNLDDCDEREEDDVNDDCDIVKVKTEQKDDGLPLPSYQAKERSKDETQPTCSTTTTTIVKTESICDTRTRLRSGAFGTSTYSRRRL